MPAGNSIVYQWAGFARREPAAVCVLEKLGRPVGIVYGKDVSAPPPSPTLVLAHTSLTLHLQTSHSI